MEALNRGLRVVGLGCGYGGKPVFKNLNFSVRPGEAVVVIGPSGSGKTTLAYCLTGIIPNRVKAEVEGRVVADGADILSSSLRENVKRVGIVLQNYEVQIFGLTVEEDLAFGLENLGLGEEEVERRIEWALDNFGLREYRSRHVHELSGGLRQRLAIASAIVTAPRYLVMDDPMMNLDWRGVIKLREIIRKLKSEGKGLVITARRLKGLEPVANKIVWLDGSRRRALVGSQPIELEDPKGKNLNDSRIAVSFDEVWFRYSKARDYVLRDITLKLESGRCIALMGPNGSGKTTLAKLVNGLHKPSRGRVKVLGMDTRRLTAAQLARYVAFVFQDPDKHLIGDTVWDEVTFGPRNLGLGFEYAERALEVMGLMDRRDDPPQSLSMGEKIRLSIASALAMNPEILILDEPTTGQDEETLEAIARIVFKLKSLGKTVLMITHDSDYALKVSDRVIVIEGGAVVADGDPEEILLNEDLVRDLGLEPPTALMKRAVEVTA